MKKSSILPSLLIICLPSVSLADLPIQGVFQFRGIACQNMLDIGMMAQSQNEELRFGNQETFIEFKGDKAVTTTKKFSFDRYGDDFCEATTTRTVTQTPGRIELKFVAQTLKPVGKNGDRACNRIQKNELPQFYSFSSRGDYLYLQDLIAKRSGTIPDCKTGQSSLVYLKKPSIQFSSSSRPAMGRKEIEMLEKIKSSGANSMQYRQLYVQFLLGQERLDEAVSQNTEIRKVDPTSVYPTKIDALVSEYKSNPDAKARSKKLQVSVLTLGMESLKTAFKPIEDLGTNLNRGLAEIHAAPTPKPMTQKQRDDLSKTSEGREILALTDGLNIQMQAFKKELDPKSIEASVAKSRAEELVRVEGMKKRFSLQKTENSQYSPSIREMSAADTCVKAFQKDKTEALKILDSAYRDFPNSPYVLQEHINMFLIDDDWKAADQLFARDSGKYRGQANMQIISEYMPKIKTAASAAERTSLRRQMQNDLVSLQSAIRSVRSPASR